MYFSSFSCGVFNAWTECVCVFEHYYSENGLTSVSLVRDTQNKREPQTRNVSQNGVTNPVPADESGTLVPSEISLQDKRTASVHFEASVPDENTRVRTPIRSTALHAGKCESLRQRQRTEVAKAGDELKGVTLIFVAMVRTTR